MPVSGSAAEQREAMGTPERAQKSVQAWLAWIHELEAFDVLRRKRTARSFAPELIRLLRRRRAGKVSAPHRQDRRARLRADPQRSRLQTRGRSR